MNFKVVLSIHIMFVLPFVLISWNTIYLQAKVAFTEVDIIELKLS